MSNIVLVSSVSSRISNIKRSLLAAFLFAVVQRKHYSWLRSKQQMLSQQKSNQEVCRRFLKYVCLTRHAAAAATAAATEMMKP